MKKRSEKPKQADDLRPEYNLTELGKGVRGKYLAKYRSGTDLVIDPKKSPGRRAG